MAHDSRNRAVFVICLTRFLNLNGYGLSLIELS